MSPSNRRCDGVTRRDAIRVGGTGLLAGLSLPELLQLQATAATEAPSRAKSCIFIFLEGGPSTIDMWDLKPDAPAEIRGPYKPIATSVPGTLFGEHCKHSAKIAHKFSILKTHSHNDNGHTTGYHYTMTGYRADFADGTNSRRPNNVLYPSIGSIVARELGPRGPLPVYMNLPHPMVAGGAGFYGAEYSPFVVEGDPLQPDFEVKDLKLVEGVSTARHARRQQILDALEKGDAPRAIADRPAVMSTYYDKARDLITAPAVRKAFDIKAEPDQVRREYGLNTLGQCCLLARRLVESGCRFIGVEHTGWDTHFTQFPSLEKDLIPAADTAFAALVSDLDRRGLLNDTLVVMMGEMGRTPRINKEAGRDHWSMAQSVLFAGGGTPAGKIIGATDKHAAAPVSDPVSVEDLLRTIFYLMGVDANKTYLTPLGRPVPIVSGGRLVKELIA